jgi:hypothetical protein
MTNQVKIRALIVIVALALEAWALYTVSLSPAHWHSAMIVKDEPQAHALYDAMTNAMREAKSLSYTAVSSGPDNGKPVGNRGQPPILLLTRVGAER